MKSMIDTSTSSQLSSLVDKNIIVLNDGDVNRIFGWALFKVQTKYIKLTTNGATDTTHSEK